MGNSFLMGELTGGIGELCFNPAKGHAEKMLAAIAPKQN